MDSKFLRKKVFLLFFPYRYKIVFILFCLISYTGLNLLIPIISKYIIDNGISLKNFNLVLWLSLLIIFIVIINMILDILKEKSRTKLVYNINTTLYRLAFNGILNVNTSYLDKRNTTEIFNDVRYDIEKIEELCSQHILYAIVTVFGFIGGMLGIFFIEWKIAIFVLVFIPIKYITIKYLSKLKKNISNQTVNASNKFGHWCGDNISAIKEIRILNIKKYKMDELNSNIHKFQSVVRKSNILDSVNTSTEIFFMRTFETIIIIIASYFIISDELSIGSLFAILTYSAQIISPVSIILSIKYHLSGILPSLQRYYSFLEEINVNKEDNLGENIDHVDCIEFKNVNYAYHDINILNNLSFSINKGEKVAIVGRNGTGKTTIFNLIERFIKPQYGEILINNRNIFCYNIESWRDKLGVINQDSYLFNLSILQNVVLYSVVDQKKFSDIIKQCDLSLPEYQNIGKNGCNLSGGQRQKLLFSRLAYHNKDIYLLDEATSNLDIVSEKLILDFLDTILKDKTVIMITHNLNILNRMNKIIYLQKDYPATIFYSPKEFLNSKIFL